ncbi:MerR family DNA-binding transcriptional regulator [Blautia sp. OM07-19]|nr:MerR family DNA-binding transcriptional regulator [Blautia sp. OM07-19]
MYSIGEVSEMFDLPVSTLRYYDLNLTHIYTR